MTNQPLFNPPAAINDRVGLTRHQTALAALLGQGQRYTTASSDPISAEDLRGWLDRVNTIGRALADYLEAPARAAVLELIDHPTLDENELALAALRVNIAGASPNQLGAEVGVAGNTVRRVEEQRMGCNPSTAKKLADRFGLRVLELFKERDGNELIVRTIAELRASLADAD